MPLPQRQQIVDRLIEFQRAVRDQIVSSRGAGRQRHQVSHATSADTIYRLDTEIEPILHDFCQQWGRDTPLVVVAEGLHDDQGREVDALVYPRGAAEADATIRLIVDPIDGTRGLMYDKRSAWALAGVAPNHGPRTRLRQIEVAVMTELPTSKMGYADVLWAIRGQGAMATRIDLRSNDAQPLTLAPSAATTVEHGFATISNFFPGTKVLASELMEHLVRNLMGEADVSKATVFDDQYISTGGQFYELMMGHDRFNADLRPMFYRMQGQPMGLCCHPYDCAAMLIAEEAGVILTDDRGGPLDGPLDVTSPISWAGYANEALRQRIEPLIQNFLKTR